jgi:hypothetical protein
LEWVRSVFTRGGSLPIPDAMLEFFLGYSMGERSATRTASLARSAAVADGTRHTNRMEDLNERVDRLVMILRAMWALMEEQGMTSEQLMAKIEEIDLQDGLADGQVREQLVECPSCQSKVAPGLRACQLCGTEVRSDTGHPLGHV